MPNTFFLDKKKTFYEKGIRIQLFVNLLPPMFILHIVAAENTYLLVENTILMCALRTAYASLVVC